MRRSWWRAGVVLAVAYVGTLAVNRSLVTVRGASMEPILWPGDRLLTIPAPSWAVTPGRVVVVEDPTRAGHLVVKRVRAVDPTGVDVRGDAPDRSTDSAAWGRVPASAVHRLVIARWPDIATPLTRRV